MIWTTFPTLIAFFIAFLIILQSIFFFRHRFYQPVRLYGLINILLITMVVAAMLLYVSDSFVFSPEFSIVMVRGVWGRVGLASILLCVALILAFGWDLTQRLADAPHQWKWYWLVILAVLAWIVTLFRINPLPAIDDSNGFQIYTYNLWCPVGIAWMVLSFAGSIMGVLHIRGLRWLAGISSMLFLAAGITFFVSQTQSIDAQIQSLWAAMTGGGFIILVLDCLIFLVRLIRSLRPKTPDERRTMFQNSSTSTLKSIKSFHLVKHQIVFLISLALILFGVFNMFYSNIFPDSLTGIIFFLSGWFLMSEAFEESWLNDLSAAWEKGKFIEIESQVWDDLLLAFRLLKRAALKVWSWIKSILSLPSPTVAIVKVIVLVIIIVVINESMDAGKTIIQPFKASGFVDNDHLADTISERILNQLVELNQELQPDIILPSSVPGGQKTEGVIYIRPTNTAATIDTVLDNSQSLDFGVIKIPPSLFVAPIQKPLRALLNVRVVSGSLLTEDNQYVLLATSNDGSTWKAPDPQDSTPTPAQDDAANTIAGLADQLAFKMLTSQVDLYKIGMTKNWPAFKDFQAGIADLNKFDASQDYSNLTNAIDTFRSAIIKDNQFGLAYYRLGLALQKDQQPSQAENAFTNGLSLLPDFIPLKNSLAYHLYDYQNYMPPEPAAVRPWDFSSQAGIQQNRRKRAEVLWLQVISQTQDQANSPDRASAFYGLCQSTLGQGFYEWSYFFCRRAEVIYSELAISTGATPGLRQAQAYVLNTMGVILQRIGGDQEKNLNTLESLDDVKGWRCNSLTFDVNNQQEGAYIGYSTPYLRAALRFYNDALAIFPEDPTIQCNAGIAEALLGESQTMKLLDADPDVHLALADSYLSLAHQANSNLSRNMPAPYYLLAFREYQKVLEKDPLNLNALNNYAYTYWLFRLKYREADLSSLMGVPGAITNTGDEAVNYSSEAARLTQWDTANHLIYADTLGEAYVATYHPEKAIPILSELLKIPGIKEHPAYDEIKWDLAQAYLCAARYPEPTVPAAQIEVYPQQAMGLLQDIRNNEADRDFQPFISSNAFPTACLITPE